MRWILMVRFFRKIKRSTGAKDGAELSELRQTDPLQSNMIQANII